MSNKKEKIKASVPLGLEGLVVSENPLEYACPDIFSDAVADRIAQKYGIDAEWRPFKDARAEKSVKMYERKH